MLSGPRLALRPSRRAMFGSPLYWIVALVLLLGVGVYAWYARYSTAGDVLRGKITPPVDEVAALEALLADAGVHPERVHVVEVDPDEPCWSHAYRTVTASVKRGRLRVYLADAQGGYYYAEATPGKPVEMSGPLITGTTSGYLVVFESVAGRADGIAWTVTG